MLLSCRVLDGGGGGGGGESTPRTGSRIEVYSCTICQFCFL